ncbi:MAG: glycine cleavage system protein H [Sutterellaceae bacterium]|nr:glycine cleavage system protein H [Burkholderiaceae bacterium]MCX7901489.1 glycine cleavage system protein H [Burkholderiaceae bacterium]MDW8430077.1 glycine cleavage system protein H [Sutterellaceae bacterium]
MSDAFDLNALPADLLYAPEQDMWVRLQADGTVVLGATHLIAQHGQFMYFSPRPVGTTVARDRSLGVMETAKTAIAIHAPLSCTILAANEAVQQDVSLVTRDAYGAGWLFRVQPTAWDAERPALMEAAAYRAWLATRLDRFAPPVEDRPPDDFGRFY